VGRGGSCTGWLLLRRMHPGAAASSPAAAAAGQLRQLLQRLVNHLSTAAVNLLLPWSLTRRRLPLAITLAGQVTGSGCTS